MNKPSSHPTPWEYKLVSMGNPLEPDTEHRANAIGKQGWELAAIDAGVWIFKRIAPTESTTPLQAIMAETVPMAEPAMELELERELELEPRTTSTASA